MASNKVNSAVWFKRIKPILESSGWFQYSEDGKTYFHYEGIDDNQVLIERRFEFREYKKMSGVFIGEVERVS